MIDLSPNHLKTVRQILAEQAMDKTISATPREMS
jgi:hypothetical protein